MTDLIVIVIIICVSIVTCCFRICASLDAKSNAIAKSAFAEMYMMHRFEEEADDDKHM